MSALRRTNEEKAAIGHLGYVALALIAGNRATSYGFSDNRGAFKVRSIVTIDPVNAHKDAEQWNHDHLFEFRTVWHVWCENRQQAQALQKSLDTLLAADQRGPPNNRFFALPGDYDMAMIGLLFGEAGYLASVFAFDDYEYENRVRNEVMRLHQERMRLEQQLHENQLRDGIEQLRGVGQQMRSRIQPPPLPRGKVKF